MARRSRHAVGASLSPQSQQRYIQDWFDEQAKRTSAFNDLQDVLIADPTKRAQIALQYAQGRERKTANVAARGLSAGGYSGADLVDLERARVTAEQAQNIKLSTAKARYTTFLQQANNQRTATDKAYAAEAGQNIQAGTGRYKNEKPAGWRPPSLGPAAPTYGSAPVGQAPAAPAPAAVKPATPTGARLTTTTAPSVLGSVARHAPKLAVGYARRRTRLA